MDYEIEFLPVGESSKSGDAILIRFGKLNVPSEQRVILIDGGTRDTGEKIVEKIRNNYSTNSIDLIISTHPDADHSFGLSYVLDNINVYKLCVHKPWERSNIIQTLFSNGKITNIALSKYIRDSLENVYDLVNVAKSKGVKVEEPFSDQTSIFEGCIDVVGPSSYYYRSLLPGFRSTPGDSPVPVPFKPRTLLEIGFEWLGKSFETDKFTEPEIDATSPENNSSVISLVKFDEDLFLFTADAGVPALTQAIDVIETKGYDLSKLKLLQIPHHGSKRNVGPKILNRILTPSRKVNEESKTWAFISAAREGAPKHPSKHVTNFLIKKGYKVHVTKGTGISYKNKSRIPMRENGERSIPLNFYNSIEDE